ncbi:MAG: ATP-binding protein [Candidatus Nitrosopolaris sp.]
MKFLHPYHIFKRVSAFANICGLDDIKDVVKRALDSDENYNLLFTGPPASAKTLFLLGILECEKGIYFDGSNSTNKILDVLEDQRPKIICINEIDKMCKAFQNKLLNFMESGRVKVDQKKTVPMIKGAKVFATSNDINRLSKPLQSRFRRLNLPPYTQDQFLEAAVRVCPKLKEDTAKMIGAAVYGKGDIRDVISISKLIRKNDGVLEVQTITAR